MTRLASTGEVSSLAELLKDLLAFELAEDVTITGLTLDSRTLQAGELFLACRGAVSDGRDFIGEALARGAAAVLCEDALPDTWGTAGTVPIIVVANLKWLLGTIAARFYGNPSASLTLIGVTGTNGKTSITHFLASSLAAFGISCGIIGTLGVGFPGSLVVTPNTTPDAVTLQKWLFNLKQSGAKVVAMEVSSHSLVQNRIGGVEFDIAIFTNLSHDHLDYHETMENYGAAKRLLFRQPKLQYAIINADDQFGRELITELQNQLTVYATTTKDAQVSVPIVSAKQLRLTADGIRATVTTPWGLGTLTSHLLGEFNLQNLLAVLTTLQLLHLDLAQALAQLAKLETTVGRMQVFGGHKQPTVVVDYAHTPDALLRVLLILREYCKGKLWCVFGCGGERDRSKRPIMGQIAERYSDHLIITNDNPRTEDPHQIFQDILQGVLCPWAVECEQDRRVAIAHAIECANACDIILVAGKGHEAYQIIGSTKLPFSDQQIVEDSLGAKEVGDLSKC